MEVTPPAAAAWAAERRVSRVSAPGSPVFTRKVMHPGTKPRDFERKETAAAEPLTLAAIDRALSTAIDRANLG